jgi:hypothetical protein
MGRKLRYIPETEPGQQAQVDWGSAWVWLGEQRLRVHVFTMVLGYSRRIFARGYCEEGLVSLLEDHAWAFEPSRDMAPILRGTGRFGYAEIHGKMEWSTSTRRACHEGPCMPSREARPKAGCGKSASPVR